MPTMAVRGIDLYYEDHGAGEPLILIQGLSYATPMWHWQVSELKRQFRVIVFDNRGSGQSAKPDVPYSIRMFADDAVGLMDGLGVERASILGISMGGLIAQEVALTYPERVSHLILCATLYGGASALPVSSETLGYLSQYQEVVSDEVCKLEIGYGTAPGFCARHPERVAKLIEFKKQTRPPRFAYFRQLWSAAGYVSEDRLPNLRIPTLILSGKLDHIIPPGNSERLQKLIPKAELKEFEGAGHHLHIEVPEEFNQAVIQFLKPFPS